MKELAEILKRRGGLRRRQGVVTAVDGATVSVLIGGSTVPVDGVHHLNSCAPAIGDVVWLDVDGADLWIIGTHGEVASGLTLEATTITGGIIRTAASGQRIEINSISADSIVCYSGISGETGAGMIQVRGTTVETAELLIKAPRFAPAGGGAIALFSGDTGTTVYLLGSTEVDGALNVTGKISPGTDWVSAISDDGIWIQDRYASTLSKRWKLVFNSNTKNLAVYNGSDVYSVALS